MLPGRPDDEVPQWTLDPGRCRPDPASPIPAAPSARARPSRPLPPVPVPDELASGACPRPCHYPPKSVPQSTSANHAVGAGDLSAQGPTEAPCYPSLSGAGMAWIRLAVGPHPNTVEGPEHAARPSSRPPRPRPLPPISTREGIGHLTPGSADPSPLPATAGRGCGGTEADS